MNRARFFDELRKARVFGNSISGEQVKGVEAILDSCIRNDVRDPHHVAHILAHVHRETGGVMAPIKETVYASHKDKNPDDATVIRRLDNAWARGQLGNVRSAYWRDGWFGRGQIQITHRDNYAKFSKILGVDLVRDPSFALNIKISADIAVLGMRDGHFRSDKAGPLSLSRYTFPRDLTNPPKTNPRRIVNGSDGSDAEVAGHHVKYHGALIAAGWTGEAQAAPRPDPKPQAYRPAPVPAPDPEPQTPGSATIIVVAGIIIAIAGAIFFGL